LLFVFNAKHNSYLYEYYPDLVSAVLNADGRKPAAHCTDVRQRFYRTFTAVKTAGTYNFTQNG